MIAFLHPWVLAGLAAAAVPILLHLLARREPPTVVFPAVRYLVTTTREHQRRLKLQNWLLLLFRTLLIAVVVLAAAAPTVPLSGVPGHSASALVLILDNSASSGAVVGGAPQIRQLIATARQVLDRATPEDVLWLITADGIPRRGDRLALQELIARLTVSPRRLDLGSSVSLAGQVLSSESRPGEIILLTDLQASALSAARPSVPLIVGRPAAAPPLNVGIGNVEPGAQPWSSDGGRLTVSLIGDSTAPLPLSARLGNRPARQALGQSNAATIINLPGSPSGWWTATTELGPDEFRLDDRRVNVVRVAPVARVNWDSASRYVAAASEVLAANHRIVKGEELVLSRLGRGASIVQPPEDPAQLGALNRALAARGIPWSYGNLIAQAGYSDSGAVVGRYRVLRRYVLQTAESGRTGVLATANGAAWIVHSGNVVLLGSRLDPEWTDLPVSAGFMPFMDLLVNRLARGEVALGQGAPGDPVTLPDLVTRVRQNDREWRVEGGGVFRPLDSGVYYLLAGQDTIGAISANLDPRESLLARAPDSQVRELWKGSRIVPLSRAGDMAFSSSARGDLRGPLLWTAFAVGLMEVALASAWRRRQ